MPVYLHVLLCVFWGVICTRGSIILPFYDTKLRKTHAHDTVLVLHANNDSNPPYKCNFDAEQRVGAH
jgi:hypothetical protein